MIRCGSCITWLATVIALPILCVGCATGTAPLPAIDHESEMKAEALMNLPRYVEWPPSAFVLPRTPLIIGVYDHSKMHMLMMQSAHGQMLNGRTVLVRRYYWPQRPNCHVLFIGKSERYRLRWLMKRVAHSTTLTVSESDDFLAVGGMVRFSMKDDNLRFHVSTTAAQDAGLKFSSKFLSVADQIVGEP